MYFKSKKTSLLILGLTAITCSRAIFLFINDPEGPNLFVVVATAVIIYFLSLAVYFYYPLTKSESERLFTGLTKLLLVIVIQVIIAVGFYFGLR
jgi:hypothetical protein